MQFHHLPFLFSLVTPRSQHRPTASFAAAFPAASASTAAASAHRLLRSAATGAALADPGQGHGGHAGGHGGPGGPEQPVGTDEQHGGRGGGRADGMAAGHAARGLRPVSRGAAGNAGENGVGCLFRCGVLSVNVFSPCALF